MAATQHSAPQEPECRIEDLRSERDAALARAAALAEVLEIISRWPDDPQPTFHIIVEHAIKLCDAEFTAVARFDDGLLHLAATNDLSSSENAAFHSLFPRPPDRRFVMGRAFVECRPVSVEDVLSDPDYDPRTREILQSATGYRSFLGVPIISEGKAIGVVGCARRGVRAFTAPQIALLKTFAEQAVIAIRSAETYRALQQRTRDLTESLEQQTATAEVLQVINTNPGNLQPVFEVILDKAMHLCRAAFGCLYGYDGKAFSLAAMRGVPAALAAYIAEHPLVPTSGGQLERILATARPVQLVDFAAEAMYRDGDPDACAYVDLGGARTIADWPLLKDGKVVGLIAIYRQEVRAFSDKEIALLENFAAQASVAMENARLLTELRERTTDLQESLEYQTATSDVLKVISRSAFELAPVFQVVLETAVRLCRADQATLYRYQDGEYRWAAGYSLSPDYERIEREVRIRPGTGTLVGRVALEGRTVQIRDAWSDPLYEVKEDARADGVHTMLGVPLLRDGVPIGVFGLARRRVEPYTDRQIELVNTFADQAVIAIENARLFDAVQTRTQELAQSVAELQALEEVLRAVNSSLDLQTVLSTIISRAVPLAQADEGMIYEFDAAEEVFVPKAAYGMSEDRIIRVRERRIRIGETYLGRSAVERRPIHVTDVQQDESTPEAPEYLPGIHAVLAVPLLQGEKVVGGMAVRRRSEGAFAAATVTLMQTFAGQSVLAIENARLFRDAEHARAAAEAALNDLRHAQDRLIQSEKMASLGQLTAGIAHEIKNPLNFVNNFSALSTELIDELRAVLAKAAVDGPTRAEVEELGAMIKGNLEKVVQHGKRADGIVKNMLLHARESSGERRRVDLNATIEEALNLAYHGARAERPGFNITLERNFDASVGMLEIYPQEFTRVMLNLFSNGFYAATHKAQADGGGGFQPTITVATKAGPAAVVIRIRDNGTGIPDSVKARLFEPFFTTKPAGEGTGLGLSLSHDIVVKQHGGRIDVDTKGGEYTEFTITLPRSEARAPS